MASMFTRMAAEAEAFAAVKEEEERQQQANEDEIDTDRMVPQSVAEKGGAEGGGPAEDPSKKDGEDAEFHQLQMSFMEMQYDDLFESLEAREADLTMVMLRASWLRQHHSEGDREALLPQRGVSLPAE